MNRNKVKKVADSHKLKQWQKELDDLTEKTGITLEQVCDYLGLSYKRDIGFYVKLPKKRRSVIGIGMAFRQPLEVINRWIVSYCMKRRLYSKDISEDMIWIYLINLNRSRSVSDINYFLKYESYQEAAFATYLTLWNEVTAGSVATGDVDEQLSDIGANDEIDALKNFVINNIDSFKTAYAKPRRMLAQYVECILRTNAKADSKGKRSSLISLRGWLDDSMINYLSGSVETINVTDIKSGLRVSDIKQIPKSRKSHISLALALGMTNEEIDRYLELMGFLTLDNNDPDEAILIKELHKWDDEHPLQREFKEIFINGNESVQMPLEDELQAVSDMLMLRQDLNDRYRIRKMKFDYL